MKRPIGVMVISMLAGALSGGQVKTHFEAAAEQLDLGGEVFIYRQIEAPIEDGLALLEEMMEIAPANDLAPNLSEIDIPAALRATGLPGIAAMGLSSKSTDGGRFINKFYLHCPRGRKGLVRALGKNARILNSAELAPAGADLVLESELDLSAAYLCVGNVMEHLTPEDVAREIHEKAAAKAIEMGVGLAAIMGRLQARLTIVVKMDNAETLTVPGPEGQPIELPKPKLFIALDGVPFVYREILDAMPPELTAKKVRGDGFVELREESPYGEIVFRKVSENGRIILASPPSFIAECTGQSPRLFDTAAFKKATRGLPEKGNGLFYLSAEATGEALQLGRELVQMGGVSPDKIRKYEPLLVRAIPHIGGGSFATVMVNSPTGVLTASNSPASWKQSAMIVPAGLLATFAFSMGETIEAKLAPGAIE